MLAVVQGPSLIYHHQLIYLQTLNIVKINILNTTCVTLAFETDGIMLH